MVNENYTNKQIIEISGASPTAVIRWKKQYLAELNGQAPTSGKAMTPDSVVKVVLCFLGFICVIIDLLIFCTIRL
jgi:hypothetical protein